jgi:hypothetical protein
VLQQLTTPEGPVVWVNLSHILKMRRTDGGQYGHITMIEFINQQTMTVVESPEEIAILANTPELSG